MDHAASLAFEYADPDRALTVERSVHVEVGDIDDDRSAATVERDGATLRVRVSAADLVRLRAGLNTWLGLVAVAEEAAAAAADVG